MNTDRTVETGQAGLGQQHWDAVYASRNAADLSWFQSEPGLSLEMIEQAGLEAGEPVIDIGGGASVLADRLLERGFTDITVLDICDASMSASRERLGGRSADIHWVQADIREFRPGRQYKLWHDRALFHFMTRPQDRAAYLEALNMAVPSGGQVIIATFAVGGPLKCSGLDIVQYDVGRLSAELGEGYSMEGQADETHITPAGSRQSFSYFRLRRI